jgi:hypothetical protein
MRLETDNAGKSRIVPALVARGKKFSPAGKRLQTLPILPSAPNE